MKSQLYVVSIILFSGLIASQFASALEVTCASPSGESIYFKSDETEVRLSYENERGPQFTPIEDGPVTEAAAAYYQMAYNDLKEVLGGFAVTWKASQCQIKSNFWLSACGGNGALVFDPQSKIDVLATGVSISQITESGASGEFSVYRFRVTLEIDGNTYFVPLSFPKEFCRALPH